MADNKKTYATSFEVKQIALYTVDDETTPYANLAGDMCKQFQYFEDIFWPSYAATMVVQDSSENLISAMPIQGFEKCIVEIDDLDGGNYSYEFRVWNISNRVETGRNQIYTLGLLSVEGMLNEGITVNKIIEGNTSTQVKKILTDYFRVPDGKIDVENSSTSIKILPTKKSPFALIRSILPKTISEKVSPVLKKFNINNPIKGGFSGNWSGGDIPQYTSDVRITGTQGKGSAGYFFFQTRRGYVFRSIDSLISTDTDNFNGKPTINNLELENKKFKYQTAKVGDPSTMLIQEIIFGKELDMIKKMREGHYSNICCFFNINTHSYEEQVYSLKDTWEQMAHLGDSDKDLPPGQVTLSKYPSRTMSTVINNEVWYSGTDVASDDPKEGGDSKSTHPYQDFQKHYLQQGLARAGILFNQQLTISLTGHLELCAGDKIEIELPNPKKESEKDSDVDPIYSGTYLIKNLNHQFNMTDDRSVYTVLDLVRDSNGIRDNLKKT